MMTNQKIANKLNELISFSQEEYDVILNKLKEDYRTANQSIHLVSSKISMLGIISGQLNQPIPILDVIKNVKDLHEHLIKGEYPDDYKQKASFTYSRIEDTLIELMDGRINIVISTLQEFKKELHDPLYNH